MEEIIRQLVPDLLDSFRHAWIRTCSPEQPVDPNGDNKKGTDIIYFLQTVGALFGKHLTHLLSHFLRKAVEQFNNDGIPKGGCVAVVLIVERIIHVTVPGEDSMLFVDPLQDGGLGGIVREGRVGAV